MESATRKFYTTPLHAFALCVKAHGPGGLAQPALSAGNPVHIATKDDAVDEKNIQPYSADATTVSTYLPTVSKHPTYR